MITMEHVCKSYRIAKRNAGFKEACRSLFRRETEEIQALKDVSFTIRDGEMVGYIGPNGAGKSSTIKILSGILTPDSGMVLVDGRVPLIIEIKAEDGSAKSSDGVAAPRDTDAIPDPTPTNSGSSKTRATNRRFNTGYTLLSPF